jgi:enoyl-[acyl-carrier protein] reductase II
MGAAGCQIGTRLVCATESIAHPEFKKAFIRASARDAVATVQFDPDLPVIPVRALVNGGTRLFMETQRTVAARLREGRITQAEAQLEIELFWAGALRRAVVEGDVENGSLMAGQSVGMVSCVQPTKEILDELIGQALAGLADRELLDTV